MRDSKLIPAVIVAAALMAGSTGAEAGDRHAAAGGQAAVGRAVPRPVIVPRTIARPVIISPRAVGFVPYRPYYYRYRPGLAVGFYAGYPYGYYPYPDASYGYYGPYEYPLPPIGYVAATPGVLYGGVRIEGAPRDAQVFADGYYVGIVDDFDGAFAHLNLTAGPHRIEIRALGDPPVAFDVRVEPGQTITYHANLRP